MTIKDVSRMSGLSERALRYYDSIGLLRPSGRTEAGYRLYDAADLARLRQILLYRELEFPLEEIAGLLEMSAEERGAALDRQIALLTRKRDRLDRQIGFARTIREKGEIDMDFSAWDEETLERYSREAEERWGDTPQYKEYRAKGKGAAPNERLAEECMAIFARFGELKDGEPDTAGAVSLVRELQAYITEHFYTCTDAILLCLGQMYTGDERFRRNIDTAGGEGTADFAARAIRRACGDR